MAILGVYALLDGRSGAGKHVAYLSLVQEASLRARSAAISHIA